MHRAKSLSIVLFDIAVFDAEVSMPDALPDAQAVSDSSRGRTARQFNDISID